MGIRRKPTAGPKLTAEIFKLFGGEAALNKRARVDARRGVSLEIDGVTLKIFVASTEKVIESHLEESCDRSIGGDVAADVVLHTVGSDHHGKRVPANQAFDFSFDFLVAGEAGLLADRNRVRVRRIRGERHGNPGREGPVADFLEDSGRQPRLAAFNDCIERFNPFPYLFELINL